MLRAKIEVTFDLDMVPGFNYEAEDIAGRVLRYLQDSCPHYNPEVKIVEDRS